jgi:hypothetical protein
MCVIITSPDTKTRPSLETLRLCEARNPHGSGVAFLQNGKAQFIKGLSADTIDELLAIIDGPAVVHFRIATVGGKVAELCHPFPISPSAPLKQYGQASAVLFHNGHWPDWSDAAKLLKLDGPVSDTRVAAVAIHHQGRPFIKHLLKQSAGRFVIFSRKGVERFGNWENIDGCHFSNTCWQPVKQAPAKPSAPAKHIAQQYELSARTPHSRSLVEQAMACFGD